MFCFVLNLFGAAQISFFIASWDFMKDDSQIGRAKKSSGIYRLAVFVTLHVLGVIF